MRERGRERLSRGAEAWIRGRGLGLVGEKRCRTPLATLGAAATPFAFTHGKRSDEHVSARHWRARLSTLTPLTFPSALGYSWVCQRRLALLPQLLFATQAGATPFPRHLNVDIPKAARVARYRTPFASSRDAESSDDPQRSLCATPTSTSPESGKSPKLALSQIVESNTSDMSEF